MPDAIIRRYSSLQHGWGTKGHAKAKCTECKESAVASVDWFGDREWTGSYCKTHLVTALKNQEKRLKRPLDVDDRRLTK